MGDFSAATSGLKISDAKSSIMEELKRMREWQDSQRQEFRNKQLMEHQKLLLQTEKNFEKYYGNNKGTPETLPGLSVSSITDQSQSGSEVSFQDQTSSINGHMLNCFSDSSHDSTPPYRSKGNANNPVASVSNDGYSSLSDISSQNPTLRERYMNEDKNTAIPNQPAPKRPVRPFLRKRAGLERYMPKKRTNRIEGSKPTIEQKTDFPERKVVLKLKPALHTSTSPPRKTNHVKFCEPIQIFDHEVTYPKQLFHQSNENSESQSSQNEVESESENFSTAESQELDDKSISSDTSLNSESKELAEFEMLENCAQNSSFNSDSSVVQRVLKGESLKPLQNRPPNIHSRVQHSNYIRPEEKNSRKTANFTNLKDLDTRKQHLQDLILGFEPKISSLQKEITNSNKSSFGDYDSDLNERCSTPVEDNATLSDCNSSNNSSINSIIFVPHNESNKDQHNATLEASDTVVKYKIAQDYSDKMDVDSTKHSEDLNRGQSNKSKLREKMEELEKEIQNYQTECSRLATISKERDVILKQLKKERDEFQKNKEVEMNKFHSEIESQKQQFKREKETFNRLKKVTKDHRNRKEREDLSTLKQEVEKLQKELKKERIKFNNETRKLKNQLTAAERERDNFKLQNITLEDQVEDLVAALKVRIALEEKAESKAQTKGRSKTEKGNNASNGGKGSFDNQDNRITSDDFKEVYINLQQDNIGDSNITKPKVRFNLAPQGNENFHVGFSSDSGIGSSNEKHIESNGSLDNDFMTNITIDSDFEKPPYEEIQYDDKLERIYNSGEVEIFFPSGTRKLVSSDGGTIKFFYSNGDEKEIFPDKRTIYRFVNGDVEKRFPSGKFSVITELVNGQTQKQKFDGSKEVTFPDGSHHIIHCDGTQEIINVDGTTARVALDGTETITFKNGEKEVRTDGYKKREYLDGSIKMIYKSGRQETRYANGRIKIKDKDGKLVVDSKHLKDLGR